MYDQMEMIADWGDHKIRILDLGFKTFFDNYGFSLKKLPNNIRQPIDNQSKLLNCC